MFCGSSEKNIDDEGNNRNEFGWWMNETEIVISSPFSKKSDIFNSTSFSNSEEREDFNLSEDSIFYSKIQGDESQNENKEKFEEIEVTVNVDFDKARDREENSIENGFRKSLGFSYTPERLVKSKEYKILSPPFQSACIQSSKFRQRKLSELIDPNKIGGTYLQKLLCSSIMEIKDSHYFDSKRYFNLNDIKNQMDEGSFSSVISNFKELKTLSKEKGNHKLSSSEEEDTSGIQSTGWSLDTSSDPTKAFPRLENQRESFNEEDGLIFENLEVDSELSTVLLDNSENFSEIQSKVKKLRDVNEDIQKDIGTLKENFENDEWKVNVLLEEAINFRREIQELKYLDDLLNLLRGELERISQKTWPFIRNHVDPYSEEINLII